MTDTVDAVLEISAEEGWQTWRMHQAPVNAINPRFLDEFERRVHDVGADGSTAVVVLTSALRIFSAGADASWMAATVERAGPLGLLEEFNATMDRFREVCAAMRRSPVLFLAALNGHTLAGGLELAAACDLRFVSDSERLQLGVPEMDLFGSMPSGGGGAQYLARLLGPSRALQFILEAKPIGPAEALSIGLVDRVVPADELVDTAQRFAKDVAAKAGRIGVAAAKRAISVGVELPLGAALELDRSVHWDSMRRGNFLPGVDAFVSRFG
jgi:enoyl-CoA hydratase